MVSAGRFLREDDGAAIAADDSICRAPIWSVSLPSRLRMCSRRFLFARLAVGATMLGDTDIKTVRRPDTALSQA